MQTFAVHIACALWYSRKPTLKHKTRIYSFAITVFQFILKMIYETYNFCLQLYKWWGRIVYNEVWLKFLQFAVHAVCSEIKLWILSWCACYRPATTFVLESWKCPQDPFLSLSTKCRFRFEEEVQCATRWHVNGVLVNVCTIDSEEWVRIWTPSFTRF